MNKNPKISVIVPVYNVEKYLHRCVDSILTQTFTDFELILVDDGSTDNSGKICDWYASKDLRVQVVHKQNEGVSIARNIGIDLAKGKWTSFVDADDWVEQNYCEVLLKEIEDNDLLYWGTIEEYEDRGKTIYYPNNICVEGRERIESAILYLKQNNQKYEYFGFTWNKLFRTEIIKNHHIRFIKGLTLREDELFTTEYCRYIRTLKVLDSALYHYRVTSSGLTFRIKSSEEYVIFSQSLNNEITYIQSQKWKDYEYNRVIMGWIQAIGQMSKFRKQIQQMKIIKKYYSSVPCTSWNKRIQLLVGYMLPVSYILVWGYNHIMKLKSKGL